METNSKHSVKQAYELNDPSAHQSFYDGWADSYDAEMLNVEGYTYPETTALRYIELASTEDTPVADLGCGTGLAGLPFLQSNLVVDGFDLSQKMLAEAKKKGCYRNLLKADLTNLRGVAKRHYGGLISCGTFTIGHLGADAMEASFDLARPGALCVIGINSQHYFEVDFDSKFKNLEQTNRITSVKFEQVPIYIDSDQTKPVNVAKLAIFRINP